MAEGFSEFDCHADQRAVNDEIEDRVVGAVAEVNVRRQRPVADVGGEGVAVELPRVAVDRGNLPGEQAAAGKAEAADVALYESMLAGRELVAQPETDHRVGPVQRPTVGDADGFAAIELREARIGEADGTREIQIDLGRHVPEAAAGIGVERREGLIAARPFPDLVQAGSLDDRHGLGDGGIGLEAEPDAGDRIGIGGGRGRMPSCAQTTSAKKPNRPLLASKSPMNAVGELLF